MRLVSSMLGMLLLATIVAGADKEPPKSPPESSEVDYDSKTDGALQVRGDTPEFVIITRDGKKAGPGTPPKLNASFELEPGTYEVSVNRTKRSVKIQAGKKTILQTGTLVVEAKEGNWWAPYEGKERRVADAPPKMNAPIALFAGKYSVIVHVGDKDEKLADDAVVEVGKKTVLKK